MTYEYASLHDSKTPTKTDDEPAVDAGHGAARGQSAELMPGVGAARGEAGSPLASSTRESMESAFGQDFSAVRVHTGGAAQGAAETLQAKAFTEGSDIYFGAGQGPENTALLAHELTHVVQGVDAAKSAISTPGDAAEVEADRVAAAVAAGRPAGPITQSATAQIHRDKVSDLSKTSKGTWYGDVDEKGALKQVRKMSKAERASLMATAENRKIIKRLFGAFNASEAMTFLSLVPMSVSWKIYFVDYANLEDNLTDKQWSIIMGLATPADLAALRKYPSGFKAFIKNAPVHLIPPADGLKALFDGVWNGKPAGRVRNFVNQLNATQKKQLRDNTAHMEILCQKLGSKKDTIRALRYLDLELKWAFWWLYKANCITALTKEDWAQYLTEASAAEWTAFKAWKSGYKLVAKHCPPAIFLQAKDHAAADGEVDEVFEDAETVQAYFNSMGAAAFLAAATQANADVAGNYAAAKGAGLVSKVIAGLDTGAKMGVRTAQNLKIWFSATTGETSVSLLQKMISKRFAVDFNSTAASGKKHNKKKTDGSWDTHVSPWTAAGLRRCWTVMERLPPAQVEQNPRFLQMLRNDADNNGNAYYWKDDVMMGYKTDGQLSKTVNNNNSKAYKDAGATINTFDATLRHEIGHAVDRQLGIMETWRSQEICGNWQKFGNYAAFVDAIIKAGGGLGADTVARHGYVAADLGTYRAAMIRAVTKTEKFNDALKAIKPTAQAAPDKGPISTVFSPGRWTSKKGEGNPWYSPGNIRTQNGRVFQRAYGGASSLYSYKKSVRDAHEVTRYQWRAPGEWFAEAYQVYYAEQEQGPDQAVGQLLRKKDEKTADMLSAVVDRGYSPQRMKDGKTEKAPNPNG